MDKKNHLDFLSASLFLKTLNKTGPVKRPRRRRPGNAKRSNSAGSWKLERPDSWANQSSADVGRGVLCLESSAGHWIREISSPGRICRSLWRTVATPRRFRLQEVDQRKSPKKDNSEKDKRRSCFGPVSLISSHTYLRTASLRSMAALLQILNIFWVQKDRASTPSTRLNWPLENPRPSSPFWFIFWDY